mgnify:CR=1 FL=1
MDDDRSRAQDGTGKKALHLRSLGPEFDDEQHAIYVRYLEEAVTDERNRNIALTGCYGVGKSSILDAFEKKHPKTTVRISITTLGPNDEGTDLTNRIQKELVKQLIYRIAPGKLRHSRFARTEPLTRKRAFLQALFISVVGLGVSWMLGKLPVAEWSETVVSQWASFVILFILILPAVYAIRWAIGDRTVSEVSTAGARIALGDGQTTYFDSFLDEIVAFFDAVNPEYVIFEDLDRFDDPQIFDSLRELNTLINASAHWRGRKTLLRFIYAIKDSLFEQLGAGLDSGQVMDSESSRFDVASLAVTRANRTKFFEVVIPVVPFIAYSNARDHLADALISLGFSNGFVSRPLLDLVARYTTDMRLMLNICNEFAVFVERLLWSKTVAPGITPDQVFALVAYKNFHLADFERISHRTSTFDTLEQCHRNTQRSLIADLQKRRRRIVSLEERREVREHIAGKLSGVLEGVIDSIAPEGSGISHKFEIGGRCFSLEETKSVDFWRLAASEGEFNVIVEGRGPYGNSYRIQSKQLDGKALCRFFPEVVDKSYWEEADAAESKKLAEQCGQIIEMLRGADFADLARYNSAFSAENTFDHDIEKVLQSELARELVRKGFITRNYAECSSIFYGSFIGVDVAFFYNHAVQANEMHVDYKFASDNSIKNLLEQVPDDFTSSVSVLNVQVVSYILEQCSKHDAAEHDAAEHDATVTFRHYAAAIVQYIVEHDDGPNVRTFLSAFLNTVEAPRDRLICQLVRHPWSDVFEYVSGDSEVPDDVRVYLFDCALSNICSMDLYHFGKTSRNYLLSVYSELTALSHENSNEQMDQIFDACCVAGLVVDDLASVNTYLQKRFVEASKYTISARNLQLALGIEEAPVLDSVRRNDSVWRYCLSRVHEYVSMMRDAYPGSPAICSESVLIDLIKGVPEWVSDELLLDIVLISDPSVRIGSITDVDKRTWKIVLGKCRVSPTLTNLIDYTEEIGFDEELCRFLVQGNGNLIEIIGADLVGEADKRRFVVDLLHAVWLRDDHRVRLAKQVSLKSPIQVSEFYEFSDEANLFFPLGSNSLFARALEEEVISDSYTSFEFFMKCGWETVSEAFSVSKNIKEFISPKLLRGFVSNFLRSGSVPDSLKRVVLEELVQYVRDDVDAARAACEYSCDNNIELPRDGASMIAHLTKDADLVARMLAHPPRASVDDVLHVLSCFDEDCAPIPGRPGDTFALPLFSSSSFDELLKHLKEERYIEVDRKDDEDRLVVTVLERD